MLNELLNLLTAVDFSGNTGMCRLNSPLPKLVIELYGQTVVFADHTPDGAYREVIAALSGKIPQALLYKWRNSKNFRERNGIVVSGAPDTVVVENKVKYAVELTLNQDTSFYGDTRLQYRQSGSELLGGL